MARARMLKPDFFRDESLCELPIEDRLLFAGLWTIADRKGRLRHAVKRIKADVFPFDTIDIAPSLERLIAGGFLLAYEVGGYKYLQIRTFEKHQHPHHREPASQIPDPPRYVPQPSLGPDLGQSMAQPQPSLTESESESEAESESESESEAVNGTPSSPPNPAGPRFTQTDVTAILDAYPLKSARKRAKYPIELALVEIARRPGIANPVEWLLARVKEYAASDAGKPGNVPNHPKEPWHWFTDGRYDDAPEAWQKKDGAKVAASLPPQGDAAFDDSPVTDEELERAQAAHERTFPPEFREAQEKRRQAGLAQARAKAAAKREGAKK